MADTIGVRVAPPSVWNQSYFLRSGVVAPDFEVAVPGFQEQTSIERRGNGGGDLSAASRVNTQPSYTGYDSLGIRLGGFYELFWRDRVHVVPSRFIAGNVLSDVQGRFELYNAGTRFLDIRQVLSISDLSADGINITLGNESTPYTLGLGQTEEYEYVINIVGPPNIDAAYLFTFSGGLSTGHEITGQRVVVFNFRPQEPMRERWSWRTDVIKHADGSEQRNSIRDLPRQVLTHEFLFGDESANRKLENLIYGRTGSVFGLPLWRDSISLTSAASSGDAVLNVTSTANREFYVGQNVVLRNLSTEAFEVGLIVSFDATSITLEQPLINNWPTTSTEVMPIKLARLQPEYSQRLWMISATEVSLVFSVLENQDVASESGFTIYQGDAVYEDELLVDGATYERRYEHGINNLDLSGTGAQFQGTPREFPDVITSTHTAEFVSRASFLRLRNFIAARRGRQKRFWSSTRRPDFTPSNVVASGTTINAAQNNYSESVFPGGARRHIEITYVDGSVDRREITSASLQSGEEVLVLDSGVSQEWSAANVSQVSYLILYRLDIDDVEFVHEWYFNGFIRFAIREIRA